MESYARLFPGRIFMMRQYLTSDELSAHLAFLAFYVQSGGPVADDDDLLRAVGLKRAAWTKLRDKLAKHGMLALRAGLLVDEDQENSLKRQAAARERAKKGAAGRWGVAYINGHDASEGSDA